MLSDTLSLRSSSDESFPEEGADRCLERGRGTEELYGASLGDTPFVRQALMESHPITAGTGPNANAIFMQSTPPD